MDIEHTAIIRLRDRRSRPAVDWKTIASTVLAVCAAIGWAALAGAAR